MRNFEEKNQQTPTRKMRGIKKISKNNHIQWKFEKTLIEWYHINTAIGLDYLTYFGGRTPPPQECKFFLCSL